MNNKVYYPLRLTEEQLLHYLEENKVSDAKEFNTNTHLVEIIVALYTKRFFEKKYNKEFLIGFEMREDIGKMSLNADIAKDLGKLFSFKENDTLIDFMIVPQNIPDSREAYAFQVKRFFAKEKNPEEGLAKEINSHLNKQRLSQDISLVIAPDSLEKLKGKSIKINLKNVIKQISVNTSSYEKIFILDNNRLIEVKAKK